MSKVAATEARQRRGARKEKEAAKKGEETDDDVTRGATGQAFWHLEREGT